MLLRLIYFFLILFVVTKAGAQANGQISVNQDQFISQDYDLTDQKQFQFIGLSYDTLSDKKSWQKSAFEAQINAAFAVGNPVLNYIDVKQLYWSSGNFTFGRRIENWNNADENFNLGMYQPNFAWNPINPETQGLTGLFLDLKPETNPSVDWGILLFLSAVYIPDQGAGYNIQNGQFANSNPYFRAPPSLAQVGDQTDQIDYSVTQPNTTDIVYNKSYAVKAYIGEPKDKLYIQVGYAYMPSNQLALGLQGDINPHSAVDVQILPAIYYHSLLSADVQYSFKHVRFGVSDLYERPEAPSFSSDWWYETYSNSNMVSPYVNVYFKNISVTAATISIVGADATLNGPSLPASTSNLVLFDRYPYKNAALISADYRFILKRFSFIDTKIKYLKGMDDFDFSVITGSATYHYNSHWSFSADYQLIAANDSNSTSTSGYSQSLYSYYENNDAVGVGAAYAF